MTQAKTFRQGGQPMLGAALLEVRYDAAPMRLPPPSPKVESELTDYEELMVYMAEKQTLLLGEINASLLAIRVRLSEPSLWDRFRLWVVSFFKE